MRKAKAVVLMVLMFGALAASAAAQNTMASAQPQKSLYERLGGLDAIKAVIDDFVGRVAADTRINMKFAKSDVPRVKLHLVEQVCAATGGPCQYTGQDMKTTHKNMKVTEGEFKALIDDLTQTLDKFNVGAQEKSELLGALAGFHDQIVEVKSDATGTPLPKSFKPAPALPQSQIDAGPAMKKPNN
jgi:hemoglobin